jgi:plastocyanin
MYTFMQYKKGNAVTWILILLVLALIAWGMIAVRDNGADDDIATTTSDTLNATDTVSLEDDMIEEIIITYGPNGFEPGTVTINKGQTVRWINQSGGAMWVASAMHPTHTVYPGSDIKKCGTVATIFDQCANGASYEFMFNEIGEWGYHNHSRANHFGKVIVQ